jgi:hypothetical protein
MTENIIKKISESTAFASSLSLTGSKSQAFFAYTILTLIISTSCLSIALSFVQINSSTYKNIDFFWRMGFISIPACMTIYQWSILIPDLIKTVRNPVKSFLEDGASKRKGVSILSNELRHYKKEDLEFVLLVVKLQTQQLKSRLGMLVGALESVGIIPLFVTTIVSGYSLFTANSIPHITLIVAILSFLYAIAFAYNLLIHKLELITLSIENRITIKSAKASS